MSRAPPGGRRELRKNVCFCWIRDCRWAQGRLRKSPWSRQGQKCSKTDLFRLLFDGFSKGFQKAIFGPPRGLRHTSVGPRAPGHFGGPESSGTLRWARGRGEGLWPLAQCLFAWKMLTFGHPESSGTLCGPRGRGEGIWPLAQCLFAWKCLDSATQKAPAHFASPDAGRAYGHSHSAFAWKCLDSATQRAPGALCVS